MYLLQLACLYDIICALYHLPLHLGQLIYFHNDITMALRDSLHSLFILPSILANLEEHDSNSHIYQTFLYCAVSVLLFRSPIPLLFHCYFPTISLIQSFTVPCKV